MLIYLDSADINEIRTALKMFSIDGVTTNPTILARTQVHNPVERLKQIREILPESKKLFVQLRALQTVKDAVREAEYITTQVGNNLCFKVPVSSKNIEIIKVLSMENYSICATAAYTVPQALICAKSGAEFVAPYVSHVDNMSLDGPVISSSMQKSIRNYGYQTHILCASFRVAAQIERIIELGVDSMTVTLPMLETLTSSLFSDNESRMFDMNWKAVYGEKTLVDF